MTDDLGLRLYLYSAMSSALMTKSDVMHSPMAQLTILRLNTSSTMAR